LRKYIEIAKIYIKAQLVWRVDVVFNMVFTITKILFAYLLWGAIFGTKTEVAGFTFYSMLSYYIISTFLNQLDMSSGISNEISAKIRNGTFSKYMTIPVNIEKYFIAMEAGVVAFYLTFDFIAAIVWIYIFKIEFVFTTNFVMIAGALLMILLGLLFMVQLNYYLGLLTLKYQEIGTFLMIKNNIVAFVTGSIVPLVLLPDAFVSVMKLFPFYYVTYLPSMLLIGRYQNEMLIGLIVIFLWCVLLQIVIQVTWKKYRRKYDGVGI
jgi:ABC-2 type transport system permease protein